MKTTTLIIVLSLTSAGLLQAGSLEDLRKSSENINIDTGTPRKASAAPKAKAKPAINTSSLNRADATTQTQVQQPVPVLLQIIVNFLKLLFSPNGDIEIANPSTEIPQMDDMLADDTEEETYVEGQAYTPINPAELPEEPFKPQPQQTVFQPQPQQPAAQPQQQTAQPQQPFQQGQPRADAGGGSVPQDLKQKAMDYFNANSGRINNKRYIGIVDFSAHSSKDRFWIIDLQSGAEHAIHVAHGTGSDPDGDGYATRFSNVPNSKASSLGFYVTGDLYTGKHGKSIRLHGLSSTNSNALARAVVLHDSNYVSEGNVRAGRSFGCLAVANSEIANALASLRGGALIYAGLSNSEF